MRTIHYIARSLCLSLSLAGVAPNASAQTTTTKIDPLPRDLEIQLALSALPRHLQDGATVYVLDPEKGFAVARKGTNGFHAFVARTGEDTMRGAWPLTKYRDDILYPISFDAAGAKANMRVFFDIAEMQAKGTPAGELKRIIQERYKTNYYAAPERPGVSHMLSPILGTYVNPDESEMVATTNNPHVMYYFPHVTNEAVGAALPAPEELRYFAEHGRWRQSPGPFVILHGAHGYMVQMLGVTETATITREHEAMLGRLCKFKRSWCLPTPTIQEPPATRHP
jgi:hypothetical protein